MDKAGRQVGSCSSSSFTMDLFGPKESSKSSTSSADLFGSIFGPPASMAHAGREASRPDFGRAYAKDKHDPTDGKNQKGNPMKKDRNPGYENPTAETCYFNSSIYYGGQEVYSPTKNNNNNNSNSPPHNFKKDGGDVGPNEGNSSSASRGNWWQGSLYY